MAELGVKPRMLTQCPGPFHNRKVLSPPRASLHFIPGPQVPTHSLPNLSRKAVIQQSHLRVNFNPRVISPISFCIFRAMSGSLFSWLSEFKV
jgi:hypothetical protein